MTNCSNSCPCWDFIWIINVVLFLVFRSDTYKVPRYLGGRATPELATGLGNVDTYILCTSTYLPIVCKMGARPIRVPLFRRCFKPVSQHVTSNIESFISLGSQTSLSPGRDRRSRRLMPEEERGLGSEAIVYDSWGAEVSHDPLAPTLITSLLIFSPLNILLST